MDTKSEKFYRDKGIHKEWYNNSSNFLASKNSFAKPTGKGNNINNPSVFSIILFLIHLVRSMKTFNKL